MILFMKSLPLKINGQNLLSWQYPLTLQLHAACLHTYSITFVNTWQSNLQPRLGLGWVTIPGLDDNGRRCYSYKYGKIPASGETGSLLHASERKKLKNNKN